MIERISLSKDRGIVYLRSSTTVGEINRNSLGFVYAVYVPELKDKVHRHEVRGSMANLSDAVAVVELILTKIWGEEVGENE